uniref:Uncharacterized protein n=1 Tax=Rhizophora mucronata TaxID=61149 RepID=A0A2P2PBP2_RHIMU
MISPVSDYLMDCNQLLPGSSSLFSLFTKWLA